MINAVVGWRGKSLSSLQHVSWCVVVVVVVVAAAVVIVIVIAVVVAVKGYCS